MKLYDLGLIVGRFQMLHKGHELMIKSALELCNRVVIFIGSSQKSNTEENPFSYYVREQMIEEVFPVEFNNGNIIVRALPDIGVGNNEVWGNYVIGVFEEEFNKKPDLYITGCEKERPSWFNNKIAPTMDELRISRSSIAVSGTEVRNYLKANDLINCKKYIPYQLYNKIDFYQSILKEIKQEPIWLYRFEHTDPTRGAWYNSEGNYCCEFALLKKLDMPVEKDIYREIYKSACKDGKDLSRWIPKEAAEDMIQQGFKFVRYLATDYFYRAYGEICFNKTNYIKKEEVTLNDIYE